VEASGDSGPNLHSKAHWPGSRSIILCGDEGAGKSYLLAALETVTTSTAAAAISPIHTFMNNCSSSHSLCDGPGILAAHENATESMRIGDRYVGIGDRCVGIGPRVLSIRLSAVEASGGLADSSKWEKFDCALSQIGATESGTGVYAEIEADESRGRGLVHSHSTVRLLRAFLAALYGKDLQEANYSSSRSSSSSSSSSSISSSRASILVLIDDADLILRAAHQLSDGQTEGGDASKTGTFHRHTDTQAALALRRLLEVLSTPYRPYDPQQPQCASSVQMLVVCPTRSVLC